MRALQFWKTVTADEADLLERFLAVLEDLPDISRLVEANPHLRSRVPEDVLARLI